MKHWLRIALLGLTLGLVSPVPGPTLATASTVAANCRYGITVTGDPARFDLAVLGVGGYLDWGLSPTKSIPGDLDYIHVVRLRGAEQRFVYDPAVPALSLQFEDTLRKAVEQAPSQAWLVGNEPDTTFEGQDSLTPDQYAQAYHNIYRLIKRVDPTAQVGIGTIVQPTPLRLQWLDAMWAAYLAHYQARPPSDFWSIHSFILREKQGDWGTGIPKGLTATAGELYTLEQTDNLQIFSQRLLDFRHWLADHGQRFKPLWITEYGSLLPHDAKGGLVTQPPERARDYMLATFKFLENATNLATGYPFDGNHLVQRWFWYSLDDALTRFGGSLYDPDTGRATVIGSAFQAYVEKSEPQPQLQLLRPAGGALATWPRRHRESVLVQVVVANTGSAQTRSPLTLTWYAGDPQQGGEPLAATTISESIAGCGAVRKILARLPFPSDLSQSLYVRLESANLANPLTLALTDWKLHPAPP